MEGMTIQVLQERVALRRDQRAYRELFLYFYKVLTPFALTLLKCPQAAEEVVSDVMLNIWQLEVRLMAIGNLRVYLFRAVKNRAINYITRTRPLQPFSTWGGDENLYDDGPNPYEKMQRKELRHCLAQAVKALPPRCGMVYHLVKEEGLSYREVAGILSISENTVDRQLNNALHKILKALRLYLGEAPAPKKMGKCMGRTAEASVVEG